MLKDLIEETIWSPEIGSTIGYCGKIESIVEISGTVWSIANVSGKTKLIRYTKVHKGLNSKEMYILRKRIATKSKGTCYVHMVSYKFTKFSMEEAWLSDEIRIDSNKKIWDGLFFWENERRVYYIIVD